MSPANGLQLPEPPRESKHGQPAFVTARSLLGLTSGMVLVDSLLGGLKPDTVALITGSSLRLLAAERYCIRVQLPPARGGLDGGAFFIDGGNSFDIYLFTEMARKHHLAYNKVLDRQLLSRAFTIYELRSLIHDSAIVFAAKKPKLLVVSEVFALFNEDVESAEARQVIGDIASSISEVSEREKVPVLITSASRPEFLTSILEEHCSVSADITDDGRRARARLLKHPWKSPLEMFGEAGLGNYNQDALGAEARLHG
jgi:hypothetical protein